MMPSAPRRTSFASATDYGFVALACSSTFAMTLVLMHLVRRDVDWLTGSMAAFATGQLSGLFITSVMMFGLGIISIAVGLSRKTRGKPLAPELVLLGTAGALTTSLGAAHVMAATSSVAHAVLAAGAGVALTTALIGMPDRLRRSGRTWRAFEQHTAEIAVASFAALVAAGSLGTAFTGMGQRAYVALVLLWLFRVSFRLGEEH